MKLLLRNGTVYQAEGSVRQDLLIEGNKVFIADNKIEKRFLKVIQCDNFFIVPGLVDVHVHFREPGQEYKETIRTGSMAAARGGYTTVCTMPNVTPSPTDARTLGVQLEAIRKDALINIIPYGRITDGDSLSDMEEMAGRAVSFSDDGHGVQSEELMRQGMIKAHQLGKIITAHCENESWPAADPRSEYTEAARDLRLAAETGCALHICHVSSSVTVALVREAKKRGVDVTCETAPHYLVLADRDASDEGKYKMNPPLRKPADRQALIEGIKDGTIDMIATDHAPHSRAEKNGTAGKILNGITGLETAFPVLYTRLVETGIISLAKLAELMSTAPAERFGLEGGHIYDGGPADLSVWRAGQRYQIDTSDFLSMGRSTPFEGMEVHAENIMTISGGKTVWEKAADVWEKTADVRRKTGACGKKTGGNENER